MHVVIRKGPLYNLTVGSIQFDEFGERLDIPVITCDSWYEGWSEAVRVGAKLVLFVDSGTVFDDIRGFLGSLYNYPHQGLVGHIIDTGERFYLHEQCFLIDVEAFDINLLDQKDTIAPNIQRSSANIHDDYTPLWIRGDGTFSHKTWQHFGESLIADHITRGNIVSNWRNEVRGIKHYIRTDEERAHWLQGQRDYMSLAERQFWILNNEDIKVLDGEKLVMPASGLCWIRNLIEDRVQEITLVDISSTQCKFANELLTKWDGVDYGTFVYDFLVKNKIMTFCLDNRSRLDKSQQIGMIKDRSIIDTVNAKFSDVFDQGFASRWQDSRNKKVTIVNDDLIKYMSMTDMTGCKIWASNIMDYKYTMLNNDYKDIEKIDRQIKELG